MEGSSNRNVHESGTSDPVCLCPDLISELPEEILIQIANLLSMREAMGTSILSKNWRYIGTNISHLDFNEKLLIKSIQYDYCNELGSKNSRQCNICKEEKIRMFVEFINKTLLLHKEHLLEKFNLSFYYDSGCRHANDIHQWVSLALMSNAREIYLNFSDEVMERHYDDEEPYNLPRLPFRPKSLEILKLNFCKFKPSSVKMFSSLRTMSLVQVMLLDHFVNDLVSRCPLLEDLTLEMCYLPYGFLNCDPALLLKRLIVNECIINGPRDLTNASPPVEHYECSGEFGHILSLSVPNLIYFEYSGPCIGKFSLKNSSLLDHVVMNVDQALIDEEACRKMGKMMKEIKHIRKLTMSSWCIEVLPIDPNQWQMLPISFENLESLTLEVGLYKCDLPGIASLLRSCPHLKTLKIDTDAALQMDFGLSVFNINEWEFWKSQRLPFDCLMHSLQIVEMDGFSMKESQMSVLKFFLGNAVQLEKLLIRWTKQNDRIEIQKLYQHLQVYQKAVMQRLLALPRASLNSSVAFI